MVTLLGLAAILLDAPVRFEGHLAHPHRLILQLSPGSKLENVKTIWRLPEIGFAAVDTGKEPLSKAKARFAKLPGVVRVDPDYAAKPAYDPNDPIWPDQWHFRTIKADLAWNASFGSPTKVAVIDTGIQVNHPDLAANIWVNAGEIAGNGIDDDHNGYVDDINGYDFAYNDANPDDQFGHGTACAGIVGAVQDNSIGVTGVAPRARIMAIKSCIDSGYFYNSMTIPAYVYAANNGARVFSMSYYCDQVSAGERTAMEYAVSLGVLPVAAAANENSSIPYYPAAYECVLSVAALNPDNSRAGFSNFGSWVDVAAPGVSLRTTATGSGYTYGFGGTSGACPHVAGLATLLTGANVLATPAQVRNAIEDTATTLIQAPMGEFANYGLVNAELAMTAILGSPAAAKSPRFRYLTPATHSVYQESMTELVSRIHGRGLQLPNVVEVQVNGISLPIVRQTRDFVDFELGSARGTLTLKVNGSTVKSLSLPSSLNKVYPLVEASTQDATLSGGFEEVLHSDGINLTCTTRGDGSIRAEGVFRLVTPNGSSMTLNLKRSYTTAGGTERVYLYDWSSWSFPYGNWIELGATPVSLGAWTTAFPVSDPTRFVDFDGSVYVLIVNSGSGGGSLNLDQIQLVDR